MTRQFRPKQCPSCNYNNQNFACMNAYGYCLAGEIYHKEGNWTGWSQFKGETDRKCTRFLKEEKER